MRLKLRTLAAMSCVAACGRLMGLGGSTHQGGGPQIPYVKVPQGTVSAGSETPVPSQPLLGLTADGIDLYKGCDDLKADLAVVLRNQQAINWNQAAYQYNNRPHGTNNGSVQADASSSASGAAQSYAAPDAAASAQNGVGASAPAPAPAATVTVGTNLQVAGVDEPDTIKISDQAIFITDNQITGQTYWAPVASAGSGAASAANGAPVYGGAAYASSANVAVMSLSPLAYQTTLQFPNLSGLNLYTLDNRLVVTGTEAGGYQGSGSVDVITYDLTSLSAPKQLTDPKTFPGTPLDSRLVNGKLILVLQAYFQTQYISSPSDAQLVAGFAAFAASQTVDQVFTFNGDKVEDIPCSSIMKVPPSYADFAYQRVVSFDVATGTVAGEVTIPGAYGGDLYATTTSIYTIEQLLPAPTWVSPDAPPTTVTTDEQLVIKKIDLDANTGALTPEAIGAVPGHLKTFDASWSFHEIQGSDTTYLAVVTTTGTLTGVSGTDTAANHLVVLAPKDKLLSSVATLDGFGAAEDVRAVNYIGDKAYVVTFKRTDPLFVIDLADPTAPKIDGELTIPGFSMYLQGDTEGSSQRLVGLGFDALDSGETDINRAFFQGLLLQLFDVSDPSNPSRLFSTDLGLRGSYSDATQDHHAFYYDQEKGLIGFPAVLFDDSGPANVPVPPPPAGGLQPGQQVATHLAFSGAILYSAKGDTLTEVKRISHYDMLPPSCQQTMAPITSWQTPLGASPDVERIYRVDDTIYTVSNFGVKAIDATTFADLGSAVVTGRECPPPPPPHGYE